MYKYNPYYVLEIEPDEEPAEEAQDEAPVGQSGDIDHPIEIGAETESSVEATIRKESELGVSELDFERRPSCGRRG